MSPFSELRGALPLALLHYHLNFIPAFLISITGNILIALLLLLFLYYCLEYSLKYFSQHLPFFNKTVYWFLSKTRQRHQTKFDLWKDFALVILVAIPLPFTGAWTGSLAAYAFGVPIRRAFYLISIGVIIAGLIVSFLTFQGIYFFNKI